MHLLLRSNNWRGSFRTIAKLLIWLAEITAIFRERALLVPQCVADEEMKKERYHNIVRGRERESDLEMERKRKPDQVLGYEGLDKRPKIFYSISRGQKGQGHYRKCGNTHDGSCRG